MQMTDSTFDAETFMSIEITEAMETKFSPIPDGRYHMSIDDLKIRKAKDAVIMDVLWNILDDDLRTKMNMQKIIVRQGVFLDVEPDGRLMTGPSKNIRLGRL